MMQWSPADLPTGRPRWKLEPLRRRADGVLDSALAESPDRRPAPPPEWVATADYLASLAHSPVPSPPWWKAGARFRASLETWSDPTSHGNSDEASLLSTREPLKTIADACGFTNANYL